MGVFSLEKEVETLTMSETTHLALPASTKFVQVTTWTHAPEQFTVT